MVKFIPQLLACLTVLGELFIAGLGTLFLLEKFKLLELHKMVKKILSKNSYYFVFLISLFGILGSLFFSDIVKLKPCALCWYQRILLYPQPILLYIGILRSKKVLKPCLLVMNTLGAALGIYQYILQRFPSSLLSPCDASGVSCVKGYQFYLGYISIPLMAATAFVLNIIFLAYAQDSRSSK